MLIVKKRMPTVSEKSAPRPQAGADPFMLVFLSSLRHHPKYYLFLVTLSNRRTESSRTSQEYYSINYRMVQAERDEKMLKNLPLWQMC